MIEFAIDPLWDTVSDIDIEPIRPLDANPTYRSPKDWLEDVDQYRRFLYLVAKYPGQVIVPTSRIDKLWHQHILNTRAYERDCIRLFGSYLHHVPSFGSTFHAAPACALTPEKDEIDLQSAFDVSQTLWAREFPGVPNPYDAHAKIECYGESPNKPQPPHLPSNT